MPNEKDKHHIFEHVTGPIIVGVVVLLGQFVINPLISRKEGQATEILQTKKVTYLTAIDLVDRFYVSLPWKDADGKPRNSKLGQRPSREEANQCLARLLLVEDDVRISETFLKCFGQGPDAAVSPDWRADIINLMRKDLYGGEPIHSKKLPLIVDLENITDTGPYKGR